MNPNPLSRVGLIGCGNISPQYFKGCQLYSNIEIVACADIDPAAARRRAAEFGVPRALTVEELLADPGIDIVLNLTTPQFHAPLNLRILEAGKHAYCEKPFATNRAEGRQVLDLARAKGLRVGCAPDTFLSAPLQTARALIDEGCIGQPIGAMAVFACPGHESWHPNPAFYYQRGGGPLLDMGPYYLTLLGNLFGPVVSVMASAKTTFAERTIGSEPLRGQKIAVQTPTHYSGILQYANGATASMLFSFDVSGRHDLPKTLVFGSEGTLALPDANHFDGDVLVSRSAKTEWEAVPERRRYEGARALGLSDMAAAIASGRPHRASGDLAYHILDVMLACDESHASGSRVEVASLFEKPSVVAASLVGEPRL